MPFGLSGPLRGYVLAFGKYNLGLIIKYRNVSSVAEFFPVRYHTFLKLNKY